jgi:hypothetical protein
MISIICRDLAIEIPHHSAMFAPKAAMGYSGCARVSLVRWGFRAAKGISWRSQQ